MSLFINGSTLFNTRKLQGIALVDITKGQFFMGNGNTFIHNEIEAITFTMQISFTFASKPKTR